MCTEQNGQNKKKAERTKACMENSIKGSKAEMGNKEGTVTSKLQQ